MPITKKYPGLHILTGPQLVSLYNRMSSSPVKKFASKATAILRVEHLLDETKAVFDNATGELKSWTPVVREKGEDPLLKEDPPSDTREDHTVPNPAKKWKEERGMKTTDEVVNDAKGKPAQPARQRAPRILLTGDEILEPTGDYSKIGKGIHTTVTDAFDGKTPVSKVIAKLVKTLDPPRSKSWEADPERYVREYVTYNMGQGALRRVD